MMRALIIASALLGTPALAQTPPGDAKIERKIAVQPFDSVGIAGWQDADITVGPQTAVVVRGSKYLVDRTIVEWRDGALNIRSTPGSWGKWSDDAGVKVMITTPSLRRLAVSGSGDIVARGIKAKDFGIAISGSGDIKVSGTCVDLKSSISGSGDVNAAELACENGVMSVAGSGDTSARLSNNASISIAGSGDMTLYGKPKGTVKANTAGSGDVIYK